MSWAPKEALDGTGSWDNQLDRGSRPIISFSFLNNLFIFIFHALVLHVCLWEVSDPLGLKLQL